MSDTFSGLIPQLQPFAHRLLSVAGAAGLQPRVTSTRRSFAQQTRLYRRYLAGQNPYPVAPPGTSAHEYGYAFDMMIESSPGQMESDLADLGYVWKSWGGIWGGDFRDPIHFEYPGFSAPAAAYTGTIPQAEAPPQDPALVQACDVLSSFTPLGGVQIADAIAEWISPLKSSPGSLERQVQAFIQGPCSYLYRRR